MCIGIIWKTSAVRTFVQLTSEQAFMICDAALKHYTQWFPRGNLKLKTVADKVSKKSLIHHNANVQ